VDRIELDGKAWRFPEDFYIAYLAAVGAPEWHGQNLDAIWDSPAGGDINQRNPPFRVRIVGVEQMGPKARHTLERFEQLIDQARSGGLDVELEMLR